MISVATARELIRSAVKRTAVEECAIPEALGRVLAEDVKSPVQLPLFSNSAMDGYALRAGDVADATDEFPVRLRLAGTIAAGLAFDSIIESGHTVQILTGAPVPDGADAVIRQEDVCVENDEIVIRRPVRLNENIRFAGEEVSVGDIVMQAGQKINPAGVGILSSIGLKTATVAMKPKVGILVTGSEIVTEAADLAPGKIFDSNTDTLSAALQQMGLQATFQSRCLDDRSRLKTELGKALQACDVVLVTGGVSVGRFDYVKELARELGVEEIFWRVKQKPGKPLFFGSAAKGTKLLFGLPGNPASALVNFYEYVRPALLAAMGAKQTELLKGMALLDKDFSKPAGMTYYLKGHLMEDGRVAILERQGSHMMSSFAQANCLVIVEENITQIKKGATVEIHLLPI